MASTDRFEKLNDGGYNNLLVVVLLLVTIYLFISGFTKSKQQTYLDNAGTDKNTQQAQALRDAMNRSGIAIMMSVDGTDVPLIMQTAQQITDYKAVADSYRVLYPGSELTTDLASELSRPDLQAFYDIVNKKTTTSTGVVTGSTVTNASLIGKQVKAILTANIRVDNPPYPVENTLFGSNKQAKAGDILGSYVTEKILFDVPEKGDRITFVQYKESAFGWYDVTHWIIKSAVKIG